jgi:probable rRNA maturation factor
MAIHYNNHVRRSGVDARALTSTMNKLLAAVNEPHSSISLTLVDDAEIRELNREHRGKDKATDVLSFPLCDPEQPAQRHRRTPGDQAEPERLLGDIVISVDTATRQAAQYDAPLQDEMYRLMIHGLLHVLGHDHEEREERTRMEAEEKRLAAVIGMPWPY